jgi:hypothetical protein
MSPGQASSMIERSCAKKECGYKEAKAEDK